MTSRMRKGILGLAGLLWVGGAMGAEDGRIRLPAHNLLVDAKVSGNLESYGKGLRGRPDHMVYDVQAGEFVEASRWHEYGVGLRKDIGVVPEGKPAYWMAEWPAPVEANRIVLSGVYPNQPQPETCWKIELRRDGAWKTLARGKGGWYDRGRFTWGGPEEKPISFDGMRVSVFSRDDRTPLRSIHFRGEPGVSWIVGVVAPIDARIGIPATPLRAGQAVKIRGETLAGRVESWRWDFGDGRTARGQEVTHVFSRPGRHVITLTFSDGTHEVKARLRVVMAPPVEARITALEAPVMAGAPVALGGKGSIGKVTTWAWDLGDGNRARGREVRHTFENPGIYRVKLTVSDGRFSDDGWAIVRAHTPETVRVPQVILDTDQKNEQDDQHYLSYGVFSELDILGVNSIHHGGGQEPANYEEILHILELAGKSGLPQSRRPFVFHGADKRLAVPENGRWEDTLPIVTEASEAIVAAARGASPSNPVWVVPVGPGTNAASAILQARAEGLDLKGRIRVMWLGATGDGITGKFNGNNDPWSMFVVARSGVDVWIIPAPVGARVRMDKRKEGDLYAAHALGQYLRRIIPARNKALYDPSCLSAIISHCLGLGWVKEWDWVRVGGPDERYFWERTGGPGDARVIREIDEKAMKVDLFNTIAGKPTRLVGVR